MADFMIVFFAGGVAGFIACIAALLACVEVACWYQGDE